jgi:hypothetical protein
MTVKSTTTSLKSGIGINLTNSFIRWLSSRLLRSNSTQIFPNQSLLHHRFSQALSRSRCTPYQCLAFSRNLAHSVNSMNASDEEPLIEGKKWQPKQVSHTIWKAIDRKRGAHHELETHVYRRRWFMLFAFVFLSLSNNSTAYSFVPIINIVEAYFNSKRSSPLAHSRFMFDSSFLLLCA